MTNAKIMYRVLFFTEIAAFESIAHERMKHMAKNEKTGVKAGKAASRVLKDGRTGKDSKTAAGSALSQRPDRKGSKKK